MDYRGICLLERMDLLPFLAIIPLGFAIVASVLRKGFEKENLFFKEGVALSCGLICVWILLFVSPERDGLWLLVMAFVLSPIGDLFLRLRKKDRNFIIGIVFFWVAHLGFFLYALSQVDFSWVVFGVLLVPFLYVFFFVFGSSERFRESRTLAFITLMYVLISCLSVTASVHLRGGAVANWVYLAGIWSLVVSDLFIGLGSFCGHKKRVNLYLGLYYLSHVLVVLAVTLE
jgi:hypothetical protein